MLLYLEHFAEVRVKLSASAGPRPIYTPHAANQTGPTRQLARRGPGHRGPPHHQRSVTSSQLMRNNRGNPAGISVKGVMLIQDTDRWVWVDMSPNCLPLCWFWSHNNSTFPQLWWWWRAQRTTAPPLQWRLLLLLLIAGGAAWAGLLRFLAPLSPSLSAPLLDMPNKDIFNLINKTKTSGPQL